MSTMTMTLIIIIHRVSEKSSTLHLAPYVRQILTEFNAFGSFLKVR